MWQITELETVQAYDLKTYARLYSTYTASKLYKIYCPLYSAYAIHHSLFAGYFGVTPLAFWNILSPLRPGLNVAF